MQQQKQKENPLNSQETRLNFWQSLEKNQKITLIVLAVFVLFLMVVWTIQFRRSLTEPFVYKGSGTEENPAGNGTVAGDAKNTDTDGDGLSDSDENNIYKTSAYLEDTDGDGIKDGDEIKGGTDPKCPEGRVCEPPIDTSAVSASQAATSSAEKRAADLLAEQIKSASLGNAQGRDEQLNQLLNGGLDAAALRKLLKESGMDETVLSQFSDEQLLNNYRALLEKK